MVADSYFLPLDTAGGAGRFRAGPDTAGPWAPQLQHGGPPNALAVVLAERALHDETGRADFGARRIASDFVGPVPVGELDTHTRVLRAARSAALVGVRIAAGGRDCLLSRIWFVRDSDTAALAPPLPDAAPVPELPAGLDAEFGYGASIEWRFVSGGMRVPGPAAAWTRPRLPLLPGHPASGLARVALVADSASGISAALDWDVWSFVNVDLDIHLVRPVRGDWLLMEAATRLGAHGSALARSTLSDVHGVVGHGLQTLVLGRIPTR